MCVSIVNFGVFIFEGRLASCWTQKAPLHMGVLTNTYLLQRDDWIRVMWFSLSYSCAIVREQGLLADFEADIRNAQECAARYLKLCIESTDFFPCNIGCVTC